MIQISPIKTTAPDDVRSALETEVHKLLNTLSISYEYVDNDAVESMEDCADIENILGVEIRKTIVLCNRKKTEFYLLVMPAAKPFNSKEFSAQMDCSRLSFASADKMETLLGVRPGSATIMGLLNDKDATVQLVIDQDVIDAEWFGCNPGMNTSHLKFKTEDLLHKLIPATEHTPRIVKL